jgi:hypothetical protein
MRVFLIKKNESKYQLMKTSHVVLTSLLQGSCGDHHIQIYLYDLFSLVDG